MSDVSSLAHATLVKRSEEFEMQVTKMWLNIIKHIDDVLDGSKLGFENFAQWADPSIDQILASISEVESVLNKIFDGAVGKVSEECDMTLMNCRQSMGHIREVQLALKHNNQDHYDAVIKMLAYQKKI